MSIGSKSSNRGLPPWFRGRLRNDALTDEWAGEREGKFGVQRGLRILNKNIDFITEEMRQNMINRRG